MRAALLVCFAVTLATATATQAAEWHALRVDAPARVIAIDTIRGQVRANVGGLWYAVVREAGKTSLKFVDDPASPNLPEGALPDGRVTTGAHNVARVWLAEPTDRYNHGILGDKIEAGSVVIEMRDGKRQTVRLKNDAVFEDLEPRVADLDGDGHDDVIVVKSYLKRGSALAVIAERRGKYGIVAMPLTLVVTAGATAVCAGRPNCPTPPTTLPGHAPSQCTRLPILTAMAWSISPCPPSTAVRCVSCRSCRRRVRSQASSCRPRRSPISDCSRAPRCQRSHSA